MIQHTCVTVVNEAPRARHDEAAAAALGARTGPSSAEHGRQKAATYGCVFVGPEVARKPISNFADTVLKEVGGSGEDTYQRATMPSFRKMHDDKSVSIALSYATFGFCRHRVALFAPCCEQD